MSYTDTVKETLLKLPIKSNCCRKAFLYGVIAARGTALDNDECTVAIERGAFTDLTVRLIREIFGRNAEKRKRSHGKEAYSLHFTSRAGAEIIRACESADLSEPPRHPCTECSGLLLRGILLASARISDPQKNYHLEFSFDRPKEKIATYLQALGYSPKSATRRKEHLLYFKDNAIIAELLSMVGASNAGFAFINAMIANQYRSDAGRRANCETGNIAKAVEASMRHIEAITLLKEHDLLSSLPPELYLTAKYKLNNPDLPLSQLASLITPPVTKSGLSHRLARIEELSKSLLKNKCNQ